MAPRLCSRAECGDGGNPGRLWRRPPLLPLQLVAFFSISGRLSRCPPPTVQKSPLQRSHRLLNPCVLCLFQ